MEHEVKLVKDAEGLGITLCGGSASKWGEQPAFVKSVKHGSVAYNNGIK